MRLIDADKLKECAIACNIHNGTLTDLCVPLYQINNAPTVEERPKGEWIYIDNDWGTFQCDQCKKHSSINYNYCPNCGADMRGDKE